MRQVTLEIHTDLTEEQFELLLGRLARDLSESLDVLKGDGHEVRVNQLMIHAGDGYELHYTIEATLPVPV